MPGFLGKDRSTRRTRKWLGAIVLVVVVFWVTPVGATNEGMAPLLEIHAGTDWYRARGEPETRVHGLLEKRAVTAGPGERTALGYQLVMRDRTIPIYAPDKITLLSQYVGLQVVINGKVVDLTSEGFGQELWVGAIGAREPGLE
jgi:hypothetical protein